MSFPPKTKKGLKHWALSFLFAVVLLGISLFIGAKIIEDPNYLIAFCLLFFLISVISILGVLTLMRLNLEKRIKSSRSNEELNYLQDELQKAKKSKLNESSYLADMSHEIRIPLSTILGMIKMLKTSDLDANQQAQLEIAEYSSEHLLQLVNMISDNSQSLDKKLVVNNTAINIESDLSKLFKVFEYQAWEKGLDFQFQFMSKTKHNFLLIGDYSKIQQILVNLVNNAIKFTNAGKIELTVDNTTTFDDYQVVTFYVKDTGRGMRKKELKYAFKTLNERERLESNDFDDIGVGLSVTKNLVEFLGGNLKVESKINEGSTFYFSLQLKKTLNLKVESPSNNMTLFNRFDYRFNVLVAEDNKMNQKVIKFLLELHGADCTFVTNGIDAVNIYKVINFDMVFMDIYMPQMDGYEATKIIKKSDKYKSNQIPIIAISASAFEEDISKAKRAGVDHFLAKPIDTNKLKKLLDKYSARRENVS